MLYPVSWPVVALRSGTSVVEPPLLLIGGEVSCDNQRARYEKEREPPVKVSQAVPHCWLKSEITAPPGIRALVQPNVGRGPPPGPGAKPVGGVEPSEMSMLPPTDGQFR